MHPEEKNCRNMNHAWGALSADRIARSVRGSSSWALGRSMSSARTSAVFSSSFRYHVVSGVRGRARKVAAPHTTVKRPSLIVSYLHILLQLT